MTIAFLVLAGVVALGDWVAVSRGGLRRGECLAKPLTLILLIVAACFADLGVAKPWVLAALRSACSAMSDCCSPLATRPAMT